MENYDGHNHDSTKSKPKQTSTANDVIEGSSYRRIEPEKALFWSKPISDGGDQA